MIWLLWREYRRNRVIVFAAIVLGLLPYASLFLTNLYRQIVDGLPARSLSSHMMMGLAGYSISLAQIAVVFLGGNAMAGERTDRAAEYMAHLPIPRGRRLIGKLFLAALVAAVTWGSNLVVMALNFADVSSRGGVILDRDFFVPIGLIAVSTLAAFSVAWFVSSFQSSATFAICSGLVAPLIVIFMIQMISWQLLEANLSIAATATYYGTSCGIVAAVGFACGTWHFLQRVEP